jgi:SAM-dependent methyltransferase
MDPLNVTQAATEHRVEYSALLDDETRRHDVHFRAAAAIGPQDRVLDVGCGTGQTTREAAQAASRGSALGVDISVPAIEHARRLAEQEALGNIAFEVADAQDHRFPAARFDLCISRFGVMFFADPIAAFTNIGRALRPGARLAIMVWQGREHNPWSNTATAAVTGEPVAPTPPEGNQHPFSLADPAVTEGILGAAGFAGIDFTGVHEPIYYGPDPDVACGLVSGFLNTRNLLDSMDDESRKQALARLRALLVEHATDDGVFFDARTWIITARYQ